MDLTFVERGGLTFECVAQELEKFMRLKEETKYVDDDGELVSIEYEFEGDHPYEDRMFWARLALAPWGRWVTMTWERGSSGGRLRELVKRIREGRIG